MLETSLLFILITREVYGKSCFMNKKALIGDQTFDIVGYGVLILLRVSLAGMEVSPLFNFMIL